MSFTGNTGFVSVSQDVLGGKVRSALMRELADEMEAKEKEARENDLSLYWEAIVLRDDSEWDEAYAAAFYNTWGRHQ